MSTESFVMWHKKHPEAITECTKCLEPLGQILVRAGITHHVNNCPVTKTKVPDLRVMAIHTPEAYPTKFKCRFD